MPLLVSLLLYLVDDSWEINWHGETIFLDTSADVGVCVRPRRCFIPSSQMLFFCCPLHWIIERTPTSGRSCNSDAFFSSNALKPQTVYRCTPVRIRHGEMVEWLRDDLNQSFKPNKRLNLHYNVKANKTVHHINTMPSSV